LKIAFDGESASIVGRQKKRVAKWAAGRLASRFGLIAKRFEPGGNRRQKGGARCNTPGMVQATGSRTEKGNFHVAVYGGKSGI